MTRHHHHGPFQALLEEHRGIVLKVASVYARLPEDRRDLAQEIRLQAWRSFPAFDPARGKFPTWLYRVALNVAISQLRKATAVPADRIEPLGREHIETIGGGEPAAPDERMEALHVLIDGLRPLDRALVLLYLEDKPQQEIAQVLGITSSNVATRLGRIKDALRRQGQATRTESRA